MIAKPAIWFPIAAILGVVNLVGAGFALGSAEPLHAAVHGALAVAFGVWAQRLRRGPADPERHDRLDVLAAEVDRLRVELSEAHERLDFAERLLTKTPDARRGDPTR